MNSILSIRGSFLAIFLAGIFSFLALPEASAEVTEQKTLCSDENGIFLGLATDEEAYSSIKGDPAKDEKDGDAQSWILTADGSPDPHSGKKPTGPINSFDKRFLQVLPDTGRSYPTRGSHLQKAKDLDRAKERTPYVSFKLKVEKDAEGIHTLFVRWTGGDTVGGGDSLYVVLYKADKKNGYKLVHGQQTVKPTMVPIDAGMSRFAGCCYDMETHACPCFNQKPDNTTCPMFIDTAKASTFGVQCRVGGGAYTIVKAPEWYLYAGQLAGDVMDFDSEPWDVTCEADGSNTHDSGHDFPSWELEHGMYDLRIYAREDGTALDAIYVAGPRGRAPTVSQRFARGDSTICVKPPLQAGKLVGIGFAGVLVLAVIWFASTRPGKEVLGSVLSKPAQAVRYVYVDNA